MVRSPNPLILTAVLTTAGNGTARAVQWRLGPLPAENRLRATVDTLPKAIVVATGRLLVPTVLVTGTVTLPPGTTLIPGSLRIRSLTTNVPVAEDGGFTAVVEAGGAQLVAAQTGGGMPVLVGWLDEAQQTLNIRTTAEALTYFDLGAFLLADLADRKLAWQWLGAADLAGLEVYSSTAATWWVERPRASRSSMNSRASFISDRREGQAISSPCLWFSRRHLRYRAR